MKEPFAKFIKTGLPPRFLLITCGLPATGKTTAVREIAAATGARLLRTDTIRREVLKGEDIFDEKAAGDMGKRNLVYEAMFRQADAALKGEARVILDATFVTQALRRPAAAIAAKHKTAFIILETVCPEAVALGRLIKRAGGPDESNALTKEAYLENKRRFEAVDLEALKKDYPGLGLTHLTVDTTPDDTARWPVIREERR
jgi:hypothetical protein